MLVLCHGIRTHVAVLGGHFAALLHYALRFPDMGSRFISLFILAGFLSLGDSSHLVVREGDVDLVPRLLLNNEEVLLVVQPRLNGSLRSLRLRLLHLVLALL